jgi:SARP family transcriptional regulator, regulator of embCAB operon
LAKPWKAPLRLYLTGRLIAELGSRRFDERGLPGRQGRRALAYLALERERPVPIDELADAVWGTASPSGAWETALSAIVSKLRACLRALDARCTVTTAAGCYQLALPPDAWVDVEAARRALDEAEGHVRAGRPRAAWGLANVAVSIAARPFLAGVEADWIGRTRDVLRSVRVRGLECLAAAAAANGEHPLAAQLAREVVTLEPFRETGWQRLIGALADGGNRAEALRAYAQCKKLLAEELDVAPSRETEAIVRGLRERCEPAPRASASRRPSSRTAR